MSPDGDRVSSPPESPQHWELNISLKSPPPVRMPATNPSSDSPNWSKWGFVVGVFGIIIGILLALLF